MRCQMAPYQQALCNLVARSCQEQGLRSVSIHNPVMELRNICNHPFISKLHVPGAEGGLPRHALPAHVRTCGKLEVLDRTLCKLRSADHRVRSDFRFSMLPGGWRFYRLP